MSSATDIAFSFVVGNKPEQLKGHKIREVRSHVSKVGWRSHVKTKDSGIEQSHPHQKRGKIREKKKAAACAVTVLNVHLSMNSQSPPGDWQLGGGRFDPFRAYPGERNAQVPALIDHCRVILVVHKPGADFLCRYCAYGR